MKIPVVALCVIVGCLVACEPQSPPEAEVRAMLVGEYCDENQVYRLQLKDDSTYFHRKAERGVLSSRSLNYESCTGVYDLVREGSSWKLHFLPDERPRNSLFKDCERIVDIWTPENGYVIGETTVRLPDLFENNALTKGLCE